MNRTLVTALAVLAAVGCTTRKQIASRPSDAGTKGVYAKPFDKVKRASLDALGELGFTVKEEGWADEYRYQIIGTQGMTTHGPGRLARVMIEKGDQERTVYTLTQSRAALEDHTTVDEAIGRDLQRKIASRLE
jgi:hypothetical protein